MKILVTAGPTREFFDPVRFLSNRSSGKMGYAVARAAVAQGHEVILVSGPTSLDAPESAQQVDVVSAEDMLSAVLDHFEWCDSLIMTAAVCDWRPADCSSQKLKKSEMAPAVELKRTADILQRVSELRTSQIVVGFAAETSNLESEARRKLESKHLDLVVANDVSRADAGFESDNNAAMFVTADSCEELPLMSKDDMAARIIERVKNLAQ